VAELEPGDAVYIPPLWFHQVEALAPQLNILMNYWRRPLAAPGAPGAWYRGLLAQVKMSYIA
jgi:oxalate decarboxylase/phosphoglucose isomerase-like protein (cupin superfamily)